MADNVAITAGAGTNIATDDIGGVQYQRVKNTFGADGTATDVSSTTPMPSEIIRPAACYRLFVPKQAVGASKVYFDLFNATGSGKTLRILSVIPVVSGEVAVTGVVAVDLFLTRTSAVGTGGTAATADGSSLTAATISKMNPADAALNANITARLSPTAGATAGAVISAESLFTEETNAGTYFSTAFDFVRRAAAMGAPHLTVPENTGIRIVQGTVASVGNIGFDVIFEAV